VKQAGSTPGRDISDRSPARSNTPYTQCSIPVRPVTARRTPREEVEF
jgi:hypothetical protein